MRRRWILAIAVMLLTSGVLAEGVDPAAVSADGWTAQAKDGLIRVTDCGGQEIAELEYEKDDMAQDLLIAADFDFDGRADLAALSRTGTANGYFSVWMNRDLGGFERCEVFDEICAPIPNEALRLIESFERISAAEYRETQYAWENDDVVLRRERVVAYQDAETVRVTERTPIDGSEQISERTLNAAQWDRILAAERQAVELVGRLYPENDAEKLVVYKGNMTIDGMIYDSCSVEINREAVCMLYFPGNEGAPILLDDEMDGLIDPAWEIGADGAKTERVR